MNLYLLATIVNALLGWTIWVSTVVAAIIVLSYITLGGLSAAIYNEVLQFFVIVAALLPLTLLALHEVGGWNGLKDKMSAAGTSNQLDSWPGTTITTYSSSFWSVVGIVFGLGFVLSFGYWTTNFVEVQRAMASKDMNSARRAPIIGSFPKMFIPFIIIIPGMMAAVLISPLAQMKSSGSATGAGGITYNDSLLLLMKQLLPNGLLGVAIAGLLAAFMAGMAANISAFNTVMSYDIWQTYIQKDKPDNFYTAFGRGATVVATALAIGTSYFASQFPNIMTYLQTLFGFFNAPLFATFILGMFWKRMTATAAWIGPGVRHAGRRPGRVPLRGRLRLRQHRVPAHRRPGRQLRWRRGRRSSSTSWSASAVTFVTEPKPDSALRGLVYSETPKEDLLDEHEDHWWLAPTKLAGVSLAMVIVLNIIFR